MFLKHPDTPWCPWSTPSKLQCQPETLDNWFYAHNSLHSRHCSWSMLTGCIWVWTGLALAGEGLLCFLCSVQLMLEGLPHLAHLALADCESLTDIQEQFYRKLVIGKYAMCMHRMLFRQIQRHNNHISYLLKCE